MCSVPSDHLWLLDMPSRQVLQQERLIYVLFESVCDSVDTVKGL